MAQASLDFHRHGQLGRKDRAAEGLCRLVGALGAQDAGDDLAG